MFISKDEKITFSAEFRDDNNNLTDPQSVDIRIKAPDGTIIGPNPMTRQSTGVYERTVKVDQSGIYYWEVETPEGFIEEGKSFRVTEGDV